MPKLPTMLISFAGVGFVAYRWMAVIRSADADLHGGRSLRRAWNFSECSSSDDKLPPLRSLIGSLRDKFSAAFYTTACFSID